MMKNLSNLKSYNFIGIPVSALTYQTFFRFVDQWITDKQGRSHHIAIINAHCASEAYSNPYLSEIYRKADLIGPDGMPFVYWLRWMLKQPCDQFDASSIVMNLAKKAKETGYTFYLYGGHPDVVRKMKQRLENLFPYIKILGYRSPPFRPLTKEEDKRICDEINSLKPDVVCVGLGTPKQDFWIDEHIHKIKGSVFVPCGAIFDFFGGRVKRAPKLVNKFGMEWLFRLFSKDINRLWYRYTVQHGLFIWTFSLQLIGYRQFSIKQVFRKDT